VKPGTLSSKCKLQPEAEIQCKFFGDITLKRRNPNANKPDRLLWASLYQMAARKRRKILCKQQSRLMPALLFLINLCGKRQGAAVAELMGCTTSLKSPNTRYFLSKNQQVNIVGTFVGNNTF
jgi:hypothetical protein